MMFALMCWMTLSVVLLDMVGDHVVRFFRVNHPVMLITTK